MKAMLWAVVLRATLGLTRLMGMKESFSLAEEHIGHHLKLCVSGADGVFPGVTITGMRVVEPMHCSDASVEFLFQMHGKSSDVRMCVMRTAILEFWPWQAVGGVVLERARVSSVCSPSEQRGPLARSTGHRLSRRVKDTIGCLVTNTHYALGNTSVGVGL